MNAGTLVLAKTTAPAPPGAHGHGVARGTWRRRKFAPAGGADARGLEASLIVIGRPCSGPRGSPRSALVVDPRARSLRRFGIERHHRVDVGVDPLDASGAARAARRWTPRRGRGDPGARLRVANTSSSITPPSAGRRRAPSPPRQEPAARAAHRVDVEHDQEADEHDDVGSSGFQYRAT